MIDRWMCGVDFVFVEWTYKHQQVAGVLRDLIARGEWVGNLPGYRKLEKRLGVNRSTLERAMEMLEAEGVIGRAEPGKRREIIQAVGNSEDSAEKFLLIVGPRPLDGYSPTPRLLIAQISQNAERLGWKVIYEWCDFGLADKSITRLERMIEDYRATRLILYSPSAEIGYWAEGVRVPCYAIGGDLSPERHQLRGSYVSFSRLVCDAAEMLRNLGHERILIPMVHGKDVMRATAIAASKASWARDIADKELERMFADQGQWLPDVLQGFWPKALASLQPSAVIVKETHEYLSLLSYCNTVGKRIPADLSVIQLSSDTTCTWLKPDPSRFEFPTEKMCRRAIQWLKRPQQHKLGLEMLSAEFLKGGTLGIQR